MSVFKIRDNVVTKVRTTASDKMDQVLQLHMPMNSCSHLVLKAERHTVFQNANIFCGQLPV